MFLQCSPMIPIHSLLLGPSSSASNDPLDGGLCNGFLRRKKKGCSPSWRLFIYIYLIYMFIAVQKKNVNQQTKESNSKEGNNKKTNACRTVGYIQQVPIPSSSSYAHNSTPRFVSGHLCQQKRHQFERIDRKTFICTHIFHENTDWPVSTCTKNKTNSGTCVENSWLVVEPTHLTNICHF